MIRKRYLVLFGAFLALQLAMPAVSRAQSGPDRSGFTMILSLGIGYQDNEIVNDSTNGLAGLNMGFGGFVTPDLAVMGRISGTNVQFTDQNDLDVVSGVGVASVQWWATDWFNLEGGIGFGFARPDESLDRETGPGAFFAAGFSFFHRRKHSLQIGLEYAPVFTDPGTVQNLGLAFGWQFL